MVGTIKALLVGSRIDRRQYWMAMPILVLAIACAWRLTGWYYGQRNAPGLWLAALVSLGMATGLALWVALRRMKDSGSPILWFAGISIGGRIAKVAVVLAGGSRNQSDMALGLFFLLVLLALGAMRSKPRAAEGTADAGPATGAPL